MSQTGEVKSITYQHDRTLLYIDDEQFYHAIADIEQSKCVKLGDIINYKPCGVNFGWFVK